VAVAVIIISSTIIIMTKMIKMMIAIMTMTVVTVFAVRVVVLITPTNSINAEDEDSGVSTTDILVHTDGGRCTDGGDARRSHRSYNREYMHGLKKNLISQAPE
jgi:hypothetical protein